MYNLAEFSVRDMTSCSMRLRRLGTDAMSLDDAANRIVRYLYEHLIDDKTRKPACALVRLFRTQTYGTLSPDRQAAVRSIFRSRQASPEMKCLTLAATAGDRLEWNDTANSHRHKAIPLVSAEFLTQFPMLSQLFIQLGVDLDTTLQAGSNLLLDTDEHTFNVFHVPNAMGSPFVPAQEDFVIPCGIRSALGFGGLLPTGNLFAVIMFSKVFLSDQTADLFKTLALSAKLALLPFDSTPPRQTRAATAGNGHIQPEHHASQVAALEQLLEVHEEVVMTYAAQGKRAEEALQDSEARLRALVQSANDVALFIDDHGLIKSWNDSAEAQFGYSVQEAYGKPCTMIIANGFEGAFDRAMHASIREPMGGMSGATSELVGRKKDGTTFPLELSLTACKTRTNLIILATLRDITERKKTESQLIEERGGMNLHINGAAVSRHEHRFNGIASGRHEPLQIGQDMGSLGIGHEVPQMHGHHLVAAIAQFFEARLVHMDEPTGPVELINHFRGILDQVAVLLFQSRDLAHALLDLRKGQP